MHPLSSQKPLEVSIAYFGFPYSLVGKESACGLGVCNAGNPGSIPGLERSLEKEMAATPIFLPGKSHGQGSLAGYSPWGLRVGHD